MPIDAVPPWTEAVAVAAKATAKATGRKMMRRMISIKSDGHSNLPLRHLSSPRDREGPRQEKNESSLARCARRCVVSKPSLIRSATHHRVCSGTGP